MHFFKESLATYLKKNSSFASSILFGIENCSFQLLLNLRKIYRFLKQAASFLFGNWYESRLLVHEY